MKKTTFITTGLCSLTMLLCVDANAQKFPDLDKSPMDAAWFPTDYKDSNKIARVIYSRPQLKGRTLTEVVPQGKVWRTGANEANEISLFTDMYLGKTKVPAGIYTLYTIPNENECVIIINKDRNVVTLADEYLDALSMVFTKADNGTVLNLGWDKVRLAIPFTK
ncbi:MAG TPA: DUF2911 domain-containing protein [Flavobacterium sp.]|nr:DUF2911 domain-containing protein [Flavobacterium sp.]